MRVTKLESRRQWFCRLARYGAMGVIALVSANLLARPGGNPSSRAWFCGGCPELFGCRRRGARQSTCPTGRSL